MALASLLLGCGRPAPAPPTPPPIAVATRTGPFPGDRLVDHEDCTSQLWIAGVDRGSISGPDLVLRRLRALAYSPQGITHLPCRPGASFVHLPETSDERILLDRHAEEIQWWSPSSQAPIRREPLSIEPIGPFLVHGGSRPRVERIGDSSEGLVVLTPLYDCVAPQATLEEDPELGPLLVVRACSQTIVLDPRRVRWRGPLTPASATARQLLAQPEGVPPPNR